MDIKTFMKLSLFLLCILPVSAQFGDFAVTDDGQLSFFTTLRMQSQQDVAKQAKIFRWDGDFHMTAIAPDGAGIVPPAVNQPFVSGDGKITGYWKYIGCASPSCGLSGVAPYSVVISGATLPLNVPLFTGRISRNGRYFLTATWPTGLMLVDLQKQSVTAIGGQTLATRNFSVANDGTAAIVTFTNGSNSILDVWTPDGGLQTVPGGDNATLAAISPDGRFVAYERSTELVLLNRATGEQKTLAHRTDTAVLSLFDFLPSYFSASFSNDGTLLYADDAKQPVLLSPDGVTRPLVNVPEGGREMILSGNGQVAWVETQTGRLLRVNTGDGSFTEVLPRTPYLSGIRAGSVPGSLARGFGYGMAMDTEISWPGAQAPVEEVKDTAFAFQIPWDYQPTTGQVRAIIHQPGNPFEQLQDIFLTSAVNPLFERGDDPAHNVLQMAHGDFHGVVTPDDPATAGETVHLFALNMGPVDQPLQTGEKAPASPPARITTPFACYLLTTDRARVEGVPVPFAGLTAGSVGEYQIDITIPTDWPSGQTTVSCKTAQNLGDNDQFWVR